MGYEFVHSCLFGVYKSITSGSISPGEPHLPALQLTPDLVAPHRETPSPQILSFFSRSARIYLLGDSSNVSGTKDPPSSSAFFT